MESIKKFNGLNGATVSREEIGEIILLAKKENQTDVIFRLFKILNDNPFDSSFEIKELAVYPDNPQGLNGVQHKGDYRLALDNCGRLKPGYKFEKGRVVKVADIVKKKPTVLQPKANGQQMTKETAKKTAVKKEKSVKSTVEPKTNGQRMTKKDFYKKLVASDQKEYSRKIDYLEGYFSLEKDLDKIHDKLIYLRETEDKKAIELHEKEVERLNNSLSLQIEQGAKFFEIEPSEFIALLNEYSEDKTEFKKAILPIEKIAKRPNYSRKRKYVSKPKVEKNGQTALFGAKKGLKGVFDEAEVKTETTVLAKVEKPISKNPNVQKIGTSNNNGPSEFYTVDGEIGKYFQQVEKKPVHSVLITLDGEQGAGKTTMLYKIMDAFGSPGNSCLFISGEEHPSSSLAIEKTEKHLSPEAQKNIDTIGEVKDVEELYSLIQLYDIIFIDSWQKLLRMVGTIQVDEDLRKRFNGKVFVIIFQQTTTGRTKGGAEVVFDGDIITKLVKMPRFADNYSYFDKNRYTQVPLETIRYNVASGKVYNPEKPEPTEVPKLSFKAIEI